MTGENVHDWSTTAADNGDADEFDQLARRPS